MDSFSSDKLFLTKSKESISFCPLDARNNRFLIGWNRKIKMMKMQKMQSQRLISKCVVCSTQFFPTIAEQKQIHWHEQENERVVPCWSRARFIENKIGRIYALFKNFLKGDGFRRNATKSPSSQTLKMFYGKRVLGDVMHVRKLSRKRDVSHWSNSFDLVGDARSLNLGKNGFAMT